ncbi:hypothetical protein Nepgr_005097 [Nepenthes gracilis]|uniref:C2H2-type domain-containing protein n=1 Tax=Nepenthes gracilis TaxID=150966 RepID=A0AAD3S2I9_NEPGR|nr:hypothetical protein Nepgr_005097 [Nepenthes gracilis]
MGILTFLPSEQATTESKKQPSKRQKTKQQQQKQKPKPKPPQPPPPSSWDQIKSLLTCKQIEGSRVHDPSKISAAGYPKMGSSCGSMRSFRDVVHGNTSTGVHRADNSPESSSLGQEARLLARKGVGSSSSRSFSGSSVRSMATGTTSYSLSSRGMPLRKLSGCYECHSIDPSRYPIIPRTTVCACSQCGEIFPKIESLEHHQAVKHAVSELGQEDSGRNIVEIIFKSSWLKRDNSICKIERILKVHNTQRTIQRFEDCRDAVKLRALAGGKKNPRCAADGNELLRFHSTSLACALGAHGSSSLCASFPACGVCTVIRHGFQGTKGVRTTASSGRAHDCLESTEGRRAMLVCRVIAGKVGRAANGAADDDGVSAESAAAGSYDSVAGGCTGIYSNLEELVVFNPRAILPCFVVIYKTLSFH